MGLGFEKCVDTAIGYLCLAVDAFGVDAQKYLDAVAGASGDLGWGYTTVEPERDRSVSQFISRSMSAH
jgi:hypothetical protein